MHGPLEMMPCICKMLIDWKVGVKRKWRESHEGKKSGKKTQNKKQDMKTQPAAAVCSFQLFYIFVILVPGDK